MKRAPPRHGNDDLFLSAIDLHFSCSFVFIQQKAVTFNVCLGPVIRQRPVDPCSKLDTEQKKKNHLCHQMLHAWSQDSSENNLFLRQLCDCGTTVYRNILREIMASYSRWYQILSTVGRIYRNSSWLLMEVNSVQAATQTAEPQAFIYTASCH